MDIPKLEAGKAMNAAMFDPETIKLFWSKVDRSDPCACWPWIGCTDRYGYGAFDTKRNGKRITRKAHRVSYALEVGPIEDGRLVRHTCDNRPCCNFNHLLKGSIQDNAIDASERGRLLRGDQNFNTKLTPENVIEIKRLREGGASFRSIGRIFSIHMKTVQDLCKGKNWKHVT